MAPSTIARAATLAAVCALAACSGSSGGTTSTSQRSTTEVPSTNASTSTTEGTSTTVAASSPAMIEGASAGDQAKTDAIHLSASDLGAGWSGAPVNSPVTDDPVAACLTSFGSKGGAVAGSYSDNFTNGDIDGPSGGSIMVATALFGDAGGASATSAQLAQPTTRTCIDDAFLALFKRHFKGAAVTGSMADVTGTDGFQSATTALAGDYKVDGKPFRIEVISVTDGSMTSVIRAIAWGDEIDQKRTTAVISSVADQLSA